ncbi:hypothetical protein LOD99_6085 [Oopsacas minuta]|uniref:Uncharacterized protein n=1 Tax=Oopsacas minuta TaxID=111878 RepID=A0AAV7JN88_9METZ|nr:hypothetical protein LOD99_6085 [Oopsacas minuta]
MEMFQILQGDANKCTSDKLRRLNSWIVERSRDESNSNSCFFDLQSLQTTYPIPPVSSKSLQPSVRDNVLTASPIKTCMKELSVS